MDYNIGILTGGKSSRMGSDKATLDFGGKSFLQRLYDEMRDVADCVYVSVAADWQGEKLNDAVYVRDKNKDTGPCEGILQVLLQSQKDWTFICATDMVFLTKEVPQFLSKFLNTEYDCVCLKDENHIHPLCAFYKKTMTEVFEQNIKDGVYKIRAALDKANVLYVDIKDTPFSQSVVDNINTKEQLAQALSKLRGI